jgi:hypothetical protein
MSKIYSICPVLMGRCKKGSENPPAERVGGIYEGPGQKIHPPAEGVGGPGKMIRKANNLPPSRRERKRGGGLMAVIIRIDKCK